MLEEVGDTVGLLRLIGGASIDPDADGGGLAEAVLGGDAQAIGEGGDARSGRVQHVAGQGGVPAGLKNILIFISKRFEGGGGRDGPGRRRGSRGAEGRHGRGDARPSLLVGSNTTEESDLEASRVGGGQKEGRGGR